ncbi:MAG: replication and repair protein RecF [Verrucomicrobia bacterium]|nr:replication and repair protein RecF [Verrucomicrobiota bacterium]
MHLRKITLRHFRNIGFGTLEFSGRLQFLVGANGQGKTNLLESAGFISALRSFRTSDNKVLISHGQQVAAIAADVTHEQLGETKVTIKLRRDGKELWCDQARVTRLGDHLGKFPTVVCSSQDRLLVRGAPAGRRRWLDLTLAAMSADYLRAIQIYARALAGRNALLKSGRPVDAELAAFERLLAPAGAELMVRRDAALKELGGALATAYARVCDGAEVAAISYAPNAGDGSVDALQARWEAGRARDAQFRTTLVGPHRDDFQFHVRGTAAKDFASEGQERALVLALRLAQAAWILEKSAVRPVLLADDVLGELDPERRRRFWSAIDPETQVIATGTSLPDAALGEWQVFEVNDGMFTEKTVAA